MFRQFYIPALILWLLIGIAQGQSLSKPSPVEARSILSALEIPFTLEAFFKAIEQDDVRVVRLFHAAGFDLNTKTLDGELASAIYLAVDRESRKVFRYLLENGVDVNAPSEWNGYTPLLQAIAVQNYEMVYALLNAGALAIGHLGSVNRDFPMFGSTPLQYALLHPDPVLVEALLNKGASVTETYGFDKATPLMWAAKDASDDVVKILLSKGASVKDVNIHGETALHYAFNVDRSKKPKLDIIRVLIEAGADVNHTAKGGRTPILMAALLGDADSVRFLLAYGADPNKVYRVEGEEIPFVILWQTNTALIDAVTGGVTPLMLASAFGYKTVADLLLRNGAKPQVVAKGQQGSHTAMTLALAGGHQELAKRIRSYQK